MKKIFVVFAATFAFAACATPPAPVPSNTSSTKAVTPLTDAEATGKEKAAWEAIQKKDYDAFGVMLASDAVEVTPTDVNDKPATIANVKDFEPTEVFFSDWKVVHLDNDALVVTYSVRVKGKYQGKDFGEQTARASSAWVNRDGKWISVYHQECPIGKPAPPPPPVKAPAASATASPAAAPATTGPDPIANEKIVWDFFRSRNYDGFASILADDFIQVLTTGVDDKAGAVKVDRFDASKSELSDWRTVKIDDDAALVVFVATGPSHGPNGERHATIWTQRDGKWLARFHHGTPIEKAPPQPPAKASPASSPAATVSPK